MPAEGRENPLLKKGNSDAFFREKYLTKNNCVYRYRRASSQHLKEETKKCREAIDEILGDITKAWA